MRTVRSNTFETNSSSTHSLIIDTEDKIRKFMKGELWYSDTTETEDRLVDKAAIVEYLKKKKAAGKDISDEAIKRIEEATDTDVVDEILDDIGYDWEFRTFYNWTGDLEYEDDTYTSPSGDKLGWVAKYGYDG